MATGILSAVKLILGSAPNITCIDAYLGATAPEAEIEAFFGALEPDDEVVILSDLLGGSVNKALLSYATRNHVYLITGVNLVVVLEVASMDESERVNAQICRELVQKGASQVVFVNDHLSVAGKAKDDFEEGF